MMSWTARATRFFADGLNPQYEWVPPWYRDVRFIEALQIIERHSRRQATWEEARRLLAVLEGR